jgi:hypothetical protein
MSVLSAVLDAVRSGAVEIVDLTTPLQESTPILRLPEPFGNTSTFRLEEISRYDDRGPAWYWNDIHTGEHTGTHLDAPVHWVTGRDGLDVSQAPMRTLVAPAAVIDKTAEAAAARRRSGRRGGVAAGAAGPASGGRREGPGGRAVVVAGGGLPRSLAVVSENHRSSHDFHSRPTVRP